MGYNPAGAATDNKGRPLIVGVFWTNWSLLSRAQEATARGNLDDACEGPGTRNTQAQAQAQRWDVVMNELCKYVVKNVVKV